MPSHGKRRTSKGPSLVKGHHAPAYKNIPRQCKKGPNWRPQVEVVQIKWIYVQKAARWPRFGRHKTSQRNHQLRLLANAVTLHAFGTLKTKLPHPFGTTATEGFSFCLLPSCLTTMLAPKFLLSFLTFLLQTDDDVDRSTDMHVRTWRFLHRRRDCSRGNVGDACTSNLEILEEWIGSVRERCGPFHIGTLSKTPHIGLRSLNSGGRASWRP